MRYIPSDTELATAHGKGKMLWPDVDVALARFVSRAIELRVGEAGLRAWPGDFYLASAACDGDPSAITAIDGFIGRLTGRFRRLVANADDASDVLQTVRERLFVGQQPRIRAYDAAGPLAHWIKVIALRTAVDRHRSEMRADRAIKEASKSDLAQEDTLANVLFKRQYHAEFQAVLRAQVSALSQRDRAVLRLHLVEGFSIEAIALGRGVHRVTVARWIWSAGETLLDGLRRHFKDRHGLVPSECDSLAHLVQSQLSLDLPHLLTTNE